MSSSESLPSQAPALELGPGNHVVCQVIVQNSEGSVELTGLHKMIYGCRVGARLLVPRTGTRVYSLGLSRILGLQLGL